MRSQAWCLAALAAMSLVSVPSPARAGWGADLGRAVMTSLVRQAANRLIQQELYGGGRGYYRPSNPYSSPYSNAYSSDYQPSPIQHHHTTASHHSSTTHRTRHNPPPPPEAAGLKYPTNDSFVPPPPPSPDLTPDAPSGPVPNFDDKSAHLVPPPPPAPSLWADGPTPVPNNGTKAVSSNLHALSANALQRAFDDGVAGSKTWQTLVSSHVFVYSPMHGGVERRTGPIKYIILHSTETAQPADAQRVIESWSRRGSRHPGAQFVVDRDGTIYTTTDPANATTHIDSARSLAPYTNDNSIGIEMVHTGHESYTSEQLASTERLVSYLQERYGIPEENVTTHHHVQPSNRTDPVGLDLTAFFREKDELQDTAMTAPKAAPDYRSSRVAHNTASRRHHS